MQVLLYALNGPFRVGTLDDADLVAGADPAFTQNAVVPAGTTGAPRVGSKVLEFEAMIELEAGLAWERNLQQGTGVWIRADGDNVADANVALVHVRRNEILAEAARNKAGGGGGKLGGPCGIVGAAVWMRR